MLGRTKMMKSEVLQEFVAMIEADAQLRPSPGEFEMAYQARVAIDRIRFAIKATESTREHPEELRRQACSCSMPSTVWKQRNGGSRTDGVARNVARAGEQTLLAEPMDCRRPHHEDLCSLCLPKPMSLNCFGLAWLRSADGGSKSADRLSSKWAPVSGIVP